MTYAPPRDSVPSAAEVEALAAKVERLEAQIAELQPQIEMLCQENDRLRAEGALGLAAEAS